MSLIRNRLEFGRHQAVGEIVDDAIQNQRAVDVGIIVVVTRPEYHIAAVAMFLSANFNDICVCCTEKQSETAGRDKRILNRGLLHTARINHL